MDHNLQNSINTKSCYAKQKLELFVSSKCIPVYKYMDKTAITSSQVISGEHSSLAVSVNNGLGGQ